MIAGRATLEGPSRFAKRAPAARGHFRAAMGVSLSSIGLGTYLGKEDAATDGGYEESIAVALASAVNVFDSAINYRGQRSERMIGRALARAFAEGGVNRDEVFVSTKGGYLPHDSEDPREARRYILETFVESGLAPRSEIVSGGHCMAPAYLRDQIDRVRVAGDPRPENAGAFRRLRARARGVRLRFAPARAPRGGSARGDRGGVSGGRHGGPAGAAVLPFGVRDDGEPRRRLQSCACP